MLWKYYTQYASKFGKLSSRHRTGKGQFSFQSKGNAKECSNYCTISLISHSSKVMLKILQARLQQNMNCELPSVQPGFRKGTGTRDQIVNIHSVQFSSVTQLCPTVCDPMNCSTPGLPVHHQHPELDQTHAHQVSDAIQTSHPLLPPYPPAVNLSQRQGAFLMSQLFVSCGHSIGASASASVLPILFRIDFL